MDTYYKNIFFSAFYFSIVSLVAQPELITNEFRSPLQIPLVLAGTFGELRTNHFHSGIDIKTKGKEGYAIIAIGDGYVSRVKVKPGGYGKALYLTHSNGYVSVYAHLRNFNDSIDDYLLNNQYIKKSYPMDLFPDSGRFLFNQGDTIGWSGNTGSSSAPHLHFEIRDAKTQEVINPLLFGFKVNDTTAPVIKNLFVYPIDSTSNINGKNDTLIVSVGFNLKHSFQMLSQSITVNGPIGFGLEVYDCLDNAPNKNGIYSLELFIDSSLVYRHDMDHFSFSETRYINSLMDYHAKKNSGLRPQKSFLDSNNKLSVYKNLKDEGRLLFDDSSSHQALYKVRDVSGNCSRLEFNFTSDTSLIEVYIPKKGSFFSYRKENAFRMDNFKLHIPEYSLYNDLYFSYSSEPSLNEFICDIHHIHRDETPVHFSYEISLKVNMDLEFRDKAVICRLEKMGQFFCLSSDWKDGFLTANSMRFGDYTALIDSIPPKLKKKSFSHNLTNASMISFEVEDELSGLASYNAFVDGEWILLAHDPKNKMLVHYFDGHISSGSHTLEIIVKDYVNNEKRLELQFVR